PINRYKNPHKEFGSYMLQPNLIILKTLLPFDSAYHGPALSLPSSTRPTGAEQGHVFRCSIFCCFYLF
ncbi:MAG: hypothetical protein KGY74_09730, partial [Candidatus Cloacimonetes bacterium]|nr:hypothetical protein [Candidatus Cloacimonadota bacterium]